METNIQPGYTVPAEEADYTALVQALDAHNDAVQEGEHHGGVSYENGEYTVYEAGKAPPPLTAEELAAQEEAAKKQAEREALPQTVASLALQLTDLQLALCELYEGGET